MSDFKGKSETVSIHRWYHCLCRKLKKYVKHFLRIISEFSKNRDYKVSIQKSAFHIQELSNQFGIWKSIITIAVQYFSINLTMGSGSIYWNYGRFLSTDENNLKVPK